MGNLCFASSERSSAGEDEISKKNFLNIVKIILQHFFLMLNFR